MSHDLENSQNTEQYQRRGQQHPRMQSNTDALYYPVATTVGHSLQPYGFNHNNNNNNNSIINNNNNKIVDGEYYKGGEMSSGMYQQEMQASAPYYSQQPIPMHNNYQYYGDYGNGNRTEAPQMLTAAGSEIGYGLHGDYMADGYSRQSAMSVERPSMHSQLQPMNDPLWLYHQQHGENNEANVNDR